MPPHAKLLLVEQIMPERLEASFAHRAIAWADLTMLLAQVGCQRREAEFCTLLESSGFALARTFKMALDYCVIECVPR